MPYPAKRTVYAIFRTDGTHMLYELTKKDYEELKTAWAGDKPVADTSIGLIGLRDIRAVVEQKPEPEVVVENRPAFPLEDLTVEESSYLQNIMREIYPPRKEDEIN